MQRGIGDGLRQMKLRSCGETSPPEDRLRGLVALALMSLAYTERLIESCSAASHALM